MSSFDEIYALVARIPFGRVCTYGLIARMLGRPRASRIVGCAMSCAPEGLPCHRVVNRFGGLCEAFSPDGKASHRLLLEREGVPFTEEGNVDLSRALWTGESDS